MFEMFVKNKVLKGIIIGVACILLLGGGWYLKEGRLWLYAAQSYIYAFPLVVMDITREQMTAVQKPGQINAPVGQFGVMSDFPDIHFRAIPRTGLDTLFATSWADLNSEPLILSVPDTSKRYYVIALFDYWSNVFASIGSRTTGTEEGHYLITGPNWQGEVPGGIDGIYPSPTRWIWVNGQMRSDGVKDEVIVTSLQSQYKLTPLSHWGASTSHEEVLKLPVETISPTAAPEQIQNMSAEMFYGRFARLMKDNPPSKSDKPMIAKLASLGIAPGRDLDIEALSNTQRRALQRGMNTFSLLEKGVQKLETKEGWIVIPANFANYGTDYLTRAAIALIGLGGIWPEDILYPTAFKDKKGVVFDAQKNYILHFPKGQLPPTDTVWSVSMYTPEGFYVDNKLNKYNIASWMPLIYNADGSLDIYIRSESPGADKIVNWLPCPQTGTFDLVARIFEPLPSALDGTWSMPGVEIVQ